MKKFRISLFLIITLIFNQACHAKFSDQYIESSRLTLKNYGFACCMKEKIASRDSEAHLDYSRAIGIYVNNGNHNSSDAYQAIENYIKINIEPNNFKSFEGDNSLFSCLEVYNSLEYKNLIKKLDVYISPE
ncbi:MULTISPECIES: hypothetical protein [Psychrobacter]|uniref:hypothetical protein n=1 Tax=Psychrobacter TaxID=497 RepID=UPI000EDBF4F8|nr:MULTISPECIES: hypothetical protein [Psychrobacter]HCT73422.1 hypothetical protein [Psychrobacter sp.]